MKRKKSVFSVLILCCLTLFLVSGCSDFAPQSSKSGATQVQEFPQVPKNANGLTCEQQNIWDRIRVTTDPTKVMWIHLISLDGKIIKRMPVRNKVTSAQKRLEPKHAAYEGTSNYLPNSGYLLPGYSAEKDDFYYRTDEFIGPDGTYGDSDNYIFWFDPMGRYHQSGTSGGIGYLITDYPIDLEDPIDSITCLYNMHEAARTWQLEQEENLKAKEVSAK